MLKDTIAAISTANQDGAIAIVRLSGDDAIQIADSLFSNKLANKASHTINYGMIIDPITHEEIDEVLVSVFKAPKTFTREDIVEINCHGGAFVTKQVLNAVLSQGARLANPGEFTQRAFLNGRIDLTQAEAINDLIKAKNQTNLKVALNGIKGSVKKLLEPLIQDLLDIIANIEVNIDYPEYDDVDILTQETVLPKCIHFQNRIETILKQIESGQIMKDGIKTVIVGKPNVGKSSLLNALLEEEKAIVTDIAGTTRDLVEGYIQLNNIMLNLIDTAGIRDTEDIVEKIGIDRSKKAIEEAQLVIVVLDGTQDLDEEDQELLELTKDKNRIIVTNKNDLTTSCSGIGISALNGEIQPLIDEIEHLFEKHKIALSQTTLNNQRQIALMKQAYLAIKQAIDSLKQGIELDLVTIDIQNCYTCLKEILGEASREDLLDALFSNFCLGPGPDKCLGWKIMQCSL